MIRIGTMAIVVWLATSLSAFGQAAYRLQPGDLIEISVVEDEKLNRQVLIRPDGRISLPLAGTVRASGRTPESLQSAISSRLSKDFVQPPNVTVSLVSLAQPRFGEEEEEELNTVFVVGQVANPGRFQYPADEPITVLKALSLSGGPGAFAARKRIQIRRQTKDDVVVFEFNYKAVESGRRLETDIELVDGDVIVVPERGFFR